MKHGDGIRKQAYLRRNENNVLAFYHFSWRYRLRAVIGLSTPGVLPYEVA